MPKPFFRFQGKGLSISQPWASAIAFAGKDVENRTWRSHYRGPLAIHGSGTNRPGDLFAPIRVVKGGEKKPLIEWINAGRKVYGLEPVEDKVILSHIVAIAMLANCVESSSSIWHCKDEWGWVLEGVIPIEPIPWVGGLNTWDCKFKYRPLRPKE